MKISKHLHSSLSLLVYLTPYFLSNVWCQSQLLFCNVTDNTLSVSSVWKGHVEIRCSEHQLKGTFRAQIDGQNVVLRTLFKYRCSNSTHVLDSEREILLPDVNSETVDVSDLPKNLTGKVTCIAFGCYENRFNPETDYRLDPSNTCSFDPPVPLYPPPIPTSILSTSSLINPSSWTVVTTSMSVATLSHPAPHSTTNLVQSTPTPSPNHHSSVSCELITCLPPALFLLLAIFMIGPGLVVACVFAIHKRKKKEKLMDMRTGYGLLTRYQECITDGLSDQVLLKTCPSTVSIFQPVDQTEQQPRLMVEKRPNLKSEISAENASNNLEFDLDVNECITDGLPDQVLLKTNPSAVSIIHCIQPVDLTEQQPSLMVEKRPSLKSEISAENGSNNFEFDLDVNVHTDIEASIAAVRLVRVTSEDYGTTYVQVANAQETYLSKPSSETSLELDTSSADTSTNTKESDFITAMQDDQEQISFEPYFETITLSCLDLAIDYHEAVTELTMSNSIKKELSRCLSMPSLQSQDNSKSAAGDSYVKPLIYTSHADTTPDCVDLACNDCAVSGKVREGYLPHLSDFSQISLEALPA